MTFSLNAGTPAAIASRNSTTTAKDRERTRLRMPAVPEIDGPKDNATILATAPNMRVDIADVQAAEMALAARDSTTSVAIYDLPLGMKTKTMRTPAIANALPQSVPELFDQNGPARCDLVRARPPSQNVWSVSSR